MIKIYQLLFFIPKLNQKYNQAKILYEGLYQKSLEMLFFLSALCDPLCFNALKLNTMDTKACTKVHKGLLIQPNNFHLCMTIML
jgi:hypothetical protein